MFKPGAGEAWVGVVVVKDEAMNHQNHLFRGGQCMVSFKGMCVCVCVWVRVHPHAHDCVCVCVCVRACV